MHKHSTLNKHSAILLAMVFCLGCKQDDGNVEPAHVTCNDLDDRGIVDRIDGVVSNKPEVFSLDGHCLEATSIIEYGDVIGVRFSPAAEDGTVPFYIQTFFVPPTGKETLAVFVPERLSNADCVDVEPGMICGHVNDVVNTPNIEVDLRGKAGTLTMSRVRNAGNGLRDYQGDLEWTIWGVDGSQTPEVYDEPSILMTGRLKLTDI